MGKWGLPGLVVVTLLAGCAEPERPPPDVVEPIPVVAHVPAPTRPVTLAERIRQEAWITRFWEQLTPAQRRRVAARLRQAHPPTTFDDAEVAPVWDTLGLAARDALIFGPAPRRSP